MTWKTKNIVNKRQIIEYTGNGNFPTANLFNGTAVTNAQLFNLNQGIVLGTHSCNYEASWGISDKNLWCRSKVQTWSGEAIKIFADRARELTHPIYKDGRHTPITLNGGFVLYTLELLGHDDITIYQNEVPTVLRLSSGEHAYDGRVAMTYYNPLANSLTIRASDKNLTSAYISSAYYYPKIERNVKNIAVILENAYSNTSIGGITLPNTSETPPTSNPGLEAGSIGRFGNNGISFDFTSIKNADNSNYIGNPNGDFLEVYNRLEETLTEFSLPFVSYIPMGEYKFDSLRKLKTIILGSVGNPVTTDGLIDFHVNSLYPVNIYIYTAKGVSLGAVISIGAGIIYYLGG